MQGDNHHAWERLSKYGILEENLLRHMLSKFKKDYPSAVDITKEQVVDILLSFHLIACITRRAWFSEEQHPFFPDDDDTFIVPSLVHQDDRKSIPKKGEDHLL